MKKFLISAPFGNYITHRKCTSICGTFTIRQRGSKWDRVKKAFKTIRKVKGGYVNRMGLLNPGIKSVTFEKDKIYSITAIRPQDWGEFVDYIPSNVKLEINLSCPNVDHIPITEEQVKEFIDKYPFVIFKLSPLDNVYQIFGNLERAGARKFHFCNTIPTSKGGESGGRLKEKSLRIIRNLRMYHPHVTMIGGGGIYSTDDVERYRSVGADHYSLATIWFKPFRAFRLLRKYNINKP